MSAVPRPTDAPSESLIVEARPGSHSTTDADGQLPRWLGPLALYAALSVGLFGLPVMGHLGSHIIAFSDLDPGTLMWMLAWWPHALLHGLNPFVTHAMFYPDGYNLTWATSMPLPSLVLAPITLGFGPAVSWNVLQLLCPTLSAFTAFLLCRHVVGRTLPALVGGYLFGFSPYVLAHLEGSPTLGLVALLPVFVLLVLKRVDGSINPRRFVTTMTLALSAQFLISPEVLASSTLFGAFALLGAIVVLKPHRARLLQTSKLLGLAYAATALLVSPYLYFFFFGRHYPPGATSFSADLFSFVLPRGLVALDVHGGPSLAHAGFEGYLGLPLVLLIVVFAWARRRNRAALVPVLCALIAAIASLGDRLYVLGHATAVWMPWRLVAQLPVLRYAIPARLVVFVTLPAALILAMWLSDLPISRLRGHRRRRLAGLGLALLAVAFIVPEVGSRAWNTSISDPPFFADGTYRAYLSRRDHVLTIPIFGPSQRWIADAGFPVTLSTGSGGQGLPSGYTRYPIWSSMLAFPYPLPMDYAAQLRTFLAAKDVTAIVVQQGFPGPWHKLFATLGVRPVVTGGVLLYRLDRPPADHASFTR